jgi:ERCC4-related helicase
MQSSTTLYGVPFKQNPRIGQTEVYKTFGEQSPKKLNVKLPTGYGKTITAIGSYAILRKMAKVNRLLMIFPTDAQIQQFVLDGPRDLMSVGITDNVSVNNVGFYKGEAVKKSLRNQGEIFAVTAQYLIGSNGSDWVPQLLSKHNWMIVVDEYHHYGMDSAWGRSVLALPYEHLLAMSATPNRKDDDSAFGPPDIVVRYANAIMEKAVKPLIAHSYNYQVDAVLENGEISSFTTDELADEAGSNSPEAIEKLRISRKMRWSPKYVSPLISVPIERLLVDRIKTGYKLQAIVGAMCVSHAEMVCKQISEMYPELKTDWVGTGPDGRSDAENADVIKKFCPPKDEQGKRNPTVDILVHVGKAGEGLDSVLVSEVIHLNSASRNNSNDQENGRAARYLPGVTGHINFDSSSEYAKQGYVGSNIVYAMDDEPKSNEDDQSDEDEKKDREERDFELPDQPFIQIWNVKLESIDSGSLKEMLEVAIEANIVGIDYFALSNDASSPEWEKIEDLCRKRRAREADKFNEESVTRQWRSAVDEACSTVSSKVIRILTSTGIRFEKSALGDIKKRINRMKKMQCGEISNDVSLCKSHYKWLKELDINITTYGVPQWLK